MELVTLRIKTEDGEQIRSSLNLVANLGIEGDRKASGGERQICLADETVFSAYRTSGKGLCVKRFMPNITTCGLDYKKLGTGTILKFGDATLEITSCKKKCFAECPLVLENNPCSLNGNCAFAKVINSGKVSKKG